MTVYANLEATEGNTNNIQSIILARKSCKIILINDSSSSDLKYRFNESENWATLKPTEILSMYFRTRTIYLQGTNIPFRFWSYG